MKFAYGKFGAPLFLNGVPMRACTNCKAEFPMDEMFALTPLHDPSDPEPYTKKRLQDFGLLRCKGCIPVDAVDGEELFGVSSASRNDLEGEDDAGKGDSGTIEGSIPIETRD